MQSLFLGEGRDNNTILRGIQKNNNGVEVLSRSFAEAWLTGCY